MGSIASCIQEGQLRARRPIAALREEQFPGLDYCQNETSRLMRDVSITELVTPVNVAEEKAKWLKGVEKKRFGNPAFKYDLALAEVVAAKRPKLEKIYEQASAYYAKGRATEERLRARLLLNRLSSAIGTTYIASGILHGDDRAALGGSVMKYNRFAQTRGLSWADVMEWAKIGVEDARAKRLVMGEQKLTDEQLERLQRQELGAYEIADCFNQAIRIYGFNYKVEVDKKATAIDVRHRSMNGYPRIVVPASRKVDGLKMVTLVRHEIDCHVRDNFNGDELFCGLGGKTLQAEDDVLLEGHAMVEEQLLQRSCVGRSPRQAVPWYTLAIADASARVPTNKDRSFSYVARKNYYARVSLGEEPAAAAKKAWGTTYRVFRGVSDTTNPAGYAFWKDKAYLQGTLEVGELYESNLRHWAEIGALELDELVLIANLYKFGPGDLPYPDKNAAEVIMKRLLL